jgi:hypothetical protein
MHWNLGTWVGMRNVPPKVQIIVWRDWHGVRWHRWRGGIGQILRGSLLLGWIEIRVWRRPSLETRVRYPDHSVGA